MFGQLATPFGLSSWCSKALNLIHLVQLTANPPKPEAQISVIIQAKSCCSVQTSLAFCLQKKFYFPLLGLMNNCQNKMGLEAVERTNM